MKIGLFGAGNMGGALLEAIIKTGKHTVSVFDPSESAGRGSPGVITLRLRCPPVMPPKTAIC